MLRELLDACPAQGAPSWTEGFAGGIVNRLDQWTSGLLVAARSVESLAVAREAFASHRLVKRYRFLTDGEVPWEQHRVEHPLAHHPKDRRKMVWKRGNNTPHRGRWYPAVTGFRRLDGALWEATMSTGVMHQIRLHAASVGLPLRGDRLYGGGGDGSFWLHHQTLEGWPDEAPTLPLPPDWPR